jgi:hypothetical protein
MFQNTPGEERLSPDFHGAGKEKRGRAGGDIFLASESRPEHRGQERIHGPARGPQV